MRAQWTRAWLLGPITSDLFSKNEAQFEAAASANDFHFLRKALIWFQAEKTTPNPGILAGPLPRDEKIRMADLLGWPSDFPSWRRLITFVIRRLGKIPVRLYPEIVAVDHDVHNFWPASPLREPFHSLFKASPEHAIQLLKELCNHAMAAWRQLHRHVREYRPPGTPLPLVITFPWGVQEFWGGEREYIWYRGLGGPDAIECGFMALEAWCFAEVERGRPVDEVIKQIVEGNQCIAILGVSALLAIHTTRLSETECGSRFIARNQRSYQCASRVYGGPSACSNQIVVPREKAEAAIVNYLAVDLLSPEAIEIAKREYQAAVLEETKRKHQDTAELDALRAEEELLRKMSRARTLSPDVAQAALDALANKRRKAASTVKISPASLVRSFALTAERYREVVRNLGKHVAKSEHSTEERELVRAMLGGHGTVFSRDGRVGARFDWIGLIQTEKSITNQDVKIGSGGGIH